MPELNPPWADKLIKKYLPQIGQLDLPAPKMEGAKLAPELGCGHYGCVLSTEKSGIVFKITTDETEAKFIAMYERLKKEQNIEPYGITKYYGIYALPEQHRNRPVFILWREEAQAEYAGGYAGRKWRDLMVEKYPGKQIENNTNAKNDYEYHRNHWETLFLLLMRFKDMAHNARIIAVEKLKKLASKDPAGAEAAYYAWIEETLRNNDERATDKFWQIKEGRNFELTGPMLSAFKGYPDQRFAFLVTACKFTAEEMESEFMSYRIGQALHEYLDAGLLMADVHTANIGFPLPSARGDEYEKLEVVITDPGHVLVLNPKLNTVVVPVLP